MSFVAIVYFSGYGHTAKQADAVAEGVKAAGAELRVYRISDAGDLPEGTLEELSGASAIIYGSPTYMGSVAWQFKKFADASSKVWFVPAIHVATLMIPSISSDIPAWMPGTRPGMTVSLWSSRRARAVYFAGARNAGDLSHQRDRNAAS
ncbi:flavodoxin family protein [Methyloferula stellata]|uniref:flavodoxin family protein n=1 Tax=Methyloferula stellata TaxID=876270 RepID=UPI000369F142|nr:flavodoxin family protein [Methyloferula stellata]